MSRGRGTKRGRVRLRLRGAWSDREKVRAEAERICTLLNSTPGATAEEQITNAGLPRCRVRTVR